MKLKSEKVIKKIIGNPKKIGSKGDLDMDGVPNKKDCQPLNPMRQDFISDGGAVGLQKWANKKVV